MHFSSFYPSPFPSSLFSFSLLFIFPSIKFGVRVGGGGGGGQVNVYDSKQMHHE